MRKKSKPTNWTRMMLLWFVLILTVNKRWLAMSNRITMFLSLHHCTLEFFQLRNASTMEVNTDWKSLRIFIFIYLKRPLSKVKSMQIFYKKCLIWPAIKVSVTERSVLGGNVNWDLKMMSAVGGCPL